MHSCVYDVCTDVNNLKRKKILKRYPYIGLKEKKRCIKINVDAELDATAVPVCVLCCYFMSQVESLFSDFRPSLITSLVITIKWLLK